MPFLAEVHFLLLPWRSSGCFERVAHEIKRLRTTVPIDEVETELGKATFLGRGDYSSQDFPTLA